MGHIQLELKILSAFTEKVTESPISALTEFGPAIMAGGRGGLISATSLFSVSLSKAIIT